MAALLATHELTAFYGDFQALFGIDFAVNPGETVAVIGAHGAGKSTFLKAIVGLIPGPGGSVTFDGAPIGDAPASAIVRRGIALGPGGLVTFDGAPIGDAPASAIVRRGIALVPEGRRLFPSLSVEENLQIGAYARSGADWTLDAVYALFPDLAERRRAPATALSGGQQQMVAIGRALMSNPRVLLCDEISLGLAPIVIRDIYARLPEIAGDGTSLVIVEQDIVRALAVSDRVYCFQEGRLSLTGRPAELTREQIHAAYFGF